MISRSAVMLMLLASGLSACASGARQGPTTAVINRVLSTAPGAAQPSTIVSTELAYARAARERGPYSAGLEFAASGALQHGRNGTVQFAALEAGRSDPGAPVTRGPRVVVKSCDGSIALSQGRFQDQAGFVGNYVTTWVRQSDGGYKWSYEVAGRDDPQPPARPEFEDGDIVVTAIDSVLGLIASCPRSDESVPPPPPLSLSGDTPGDAQLSRDGTLRWRWEQQADGTKYVLAEYFYEGEWVTAIEESLASPPDQ
jgi:hypothetical protein